MSRDDDQQPEDEMAEFEVIHLSDEDGEESAWGFLGTVERAGQEYALLAPLDQLMDDDNDTMEVALLRYSETEDGSETFQEIEDDDERAQVERLATAFLSGEGYMQA